MMGGSYVVDALLAKVQEGWFPVVLAILSVLVMPFIMWLQAPPTPKPFLDPKEDYRPLKLVEKRFITHNTVRLRFELPLRRQRLGLPIGQHISFKATGADGKDVFRSYTPVSDDDAAGCVEFVIKLYPEGKMSQILKALEVGQSILMRGPKGKLTYTPNMKRAIGMIAGGTGITPMYQILHAILKNPGDKTQISLVYGNLTKADILLRAELAALAAERPKQLKVYHVLNTPPEGWTQGSGFITADILKERLPLPSSDTLILSCGPPAMIEAMKTHLDSLGYDASEQFAF